MSNTHRSHRRKKSNAGRLGLAGALTGILGIGAVAVGYVVLMPESEPTAKTGAGVQGQDTVPGGGDTGGSSAPKTGPTLSVTTPEGYGYGLGAYRAGTAEKPLSRSTPAPPGTTYAYAEYVLTNTQQQPVLLDFPADLFVDRRHVPASALSRCMPQPGVPGTLCTLPSHSQVAARLNGSDAPIIQDGDTLMPPGASYLIRIATDLPIKPSIGVGGIRLYVWNARFTSDRKGVEVELPS